MSSGAEERKWIPDLEIEGAQIKWAFSHFDGREDTFNAEGDHNFTVILAEELALKLQDDGWSIRKMEPYEEGDPPEFLLKVKISYKFEPPKIYLIKHNAEGIARKIRASQRDLSDIRRDTTEQIDVIITPSRWVHGRDSGITAYVKELYATVRQSRFSERYSDLEEIG
jgi:hypothetical protein